LPRGVLREPGEARLLRAPRRLGGSVVRRRRRRHERTEVLGVGAGGGGDLCGAVGGGARLVRHAAHYLPTCPPGRRAGPPAPGPPGGPGAGGRSPACGQRPEPSSRVRRTGSVTASPGSEFSPMTSMTA